MMHLFELKKENKFNGIYIVIEIAINRLTLMVCLPLVSSGTVVFLPLISVAGVGLSFLARRPEGLGLRDLPNE